MISASEVINTLVEKASKAKTALSSYDEVKTQAVNALMDGIIASSAFRTVFEGIMMSTSAAVSSRARVYGGPIRDTTHGFSTANQLVSNILMGVIGLTDITLLTTEAAVAALRKSSSFSWLSDFYESAQSVPNIEGIPIASSSLSKVREVDVGSQMMIVQKNSQKKYWTDNAVPKLKEWSLEGMITLAIPAIDSLFVIKPSLKVQYDFLDMCAESRRPVLFKDNRGTFQLVQIVSLKSLEEASYNNVIKVSITLREYRPFEVETRTSNVQYATAVTSNE